MPKVLLISDIVPHNSYTAGAVLEAVLNEMPRSWEKTSIVIGDRHLKQYPLKAATKNLFFTQKPRVQFSGIQPKWAKGLIENFVWKNESVSIAKRVQLLIDRLNPDIIILAVQCQALTRICTLLNYNDARIVSFMWDHPSWWANAHGLSSTATKRFLAEWKKLFETSNVRVLPSERAFGLFSNSSSTRNVVLYPNLVSEKGNLTSKELMKTNSRYFEIGFAGQIYAANEFKEFVALLELMNWKIGDKKIRLHIFGGSNGNIKSKGITYHGWKPANIVAAKLEKMDAAFLPYPGETELEIIAQTSFPSKLGLYLHANLPIIYNGPSNAAVYDFIVREDIGFLISAESWEQDFTKFTNKLDEYKHNCGVAYSNTFSSESFQKRISEIFEVENHIITYESENSPVLGVRSIRHGTWGKTIGFVEQQTLPKVNVTYWNRISYSELTGYALRPIFTISTAFKLAVNKSSNYFLTSIGPKIIGIARHFSMNMFYAIKLILLPRKSNNLSSIWAEGKERVAK